MMPGVDDVSGGEGSGIAYIDHDRAAIDQPHRIGGGEAAGTLGTTTELVEGDKEDHDHQRGHKKGMIPRKLQNPFHDRPRQRSKRGIIARPVSPRLCGVVCVVLASAWLGLCGCLGWPSQAQAQSAEQSERELQQLRARMQELQQQLQRQTSRRDALAAELRDAETAGGRLSRQLAATAEELAAATRRAQDLAATRDRAAAAALAEREQLASQLRVTFQSGRQERLRLLLNQQDPATLGRMLVYHDYLNRYRSGQLDTLLASLAEVRRLSGEADAAQRSLQGLQARQRGELADLEQARAARAQALARVEAELAGTGGELATLERQATALTELIERLRRELAGFPADPQTPIASLRGSLAWPASGRALRGFGDSRGDGGLRWNGVLLEAPRGAPVRAIHHGRVVYSDWLPGMGLLLVIDHGAGYMSLYGHNESLLREPGDWVAPGEAVASVGDTGGQSQAGLYFEIRKDGRPVNPRPWMRSAPAP